MGNFDWFCWMVIDYKDENDVCLMVCKINSVSIGNDFSGGVEWL